MPDEGKPSRRDVCEMEEQCDLVERAVLLEVLSEEASSLHVDTHCREHDREVVFMAVVHAFRRPLD